MRTDTNGCIRVTPALNPAEADFLRELAGSGGTLRGTPTGRGRQDVPFARSAWEVCVDGCCLTWRAGESAKWIVETMEFVIDHLLRSEAVGVGHGTLAGFTFDHVLSGAVTVPHSYAESVLVQVNDNVVGSRRVPLPCEEIMSRGQRAERGSRPLPANVVELRPRRA